MNYFDEENLLRDAKRYSKDLTEHPLAPQKFYVFGFSEQYKINFDYYAFGLKRGYKMDKNNIDPILEKLKIVEKFEEDENIKSDVRKIVRILNEQKSGKSRKSPEYWVERLEQLKKNIEYYERVCKDNEKTKELFSFGQIEYVLEDFLSVRHLFKKEVSALEKHELDWRTAEKKRRRSLDIEYEDTQVLKNNIDKIIKSLKERKCQT